MKSRPIIWTLLIGLYLWLPACSEEPGATGAAGDWIKGKALSVKVGMVGSMQRTPFVTLRNDSDKEAKVSPIKVVAWYSQAGKKEASLSEASVEKPPQLKPKEEVEFPFPAAGATEFPQKIRVHVGPEGSGEYEIFTATFK